MPRRTGPLADLRLALDWIAVLWAVEALDIVLTLLLFPGRGWGGGYLDVLLGLQPLTVWGLVGIPCAPFLHAGLAHLVMNSTALLVLGWLGCRYSRRLTGLAAIYAALYAGALTWLIGGIGAPDGQVVIHVGASGVLFGLVGFLVVNGLVRLEFGAALIGLVTGLLFWRILPGILPAAHDGPVLVSWQMHLGGLLGGVTAAWQLRRRKA